MTENILMGQLQGMLGALIVWWPASFWLQWTMAEGTVHTGSPAKFPTKPTEEWKKNRKMYAKKQIQICAEYRDMLPRPRLDLSGTPGLRPIGLSPGSWQTSLGLGSMSRYSAQILICILYPKMLHSEQKCAHFCSEWRIVGYGTFAFWIWETRLLASIALLWLAGINLCWGITNHNEFWGHATRGNFNRFSQTTDSSLTHP